jgi:hypothetical protein
MKTGVELLGGDKFLGVFKQAYALALAVAPA